MSEEEKILPEGWKWVKLEEIGKIETGTTPSKSNSNYYGNDYPFYKPTDLEQGINTKAATDNLSTEGFAKTRNLPKNSILVTCIGATIGKTGLILREGASNQQINAVIPNAEHDPIFVYYQITWSKFQNKIKENASSTTLPILNKTKFKQLEFITTDIKSQQAIVSKIEELFSELDNGIAQLKTAQQQLNTYRQSVLKWAFEGSKNTTTVGTLFDFKGGGTPSKQVPTYWNGNIPWASVKDIKGDFLNKTIDAISEEGLLNSAANLAEPTDVILITRISPGKAIISNIKTAVNQDLKIVKPKFKTTSKYVFYLFKSIERKCVKLSSGTTVLGINLTNLKEIEIPELTFDEQRYIVDEIDRRLSVADKLQETIDTALAQSESLRQSILKQAFEGKLVVEKKADIFKPKNTYFYQAQILGFITEYSKEKNIRHGEMTIAKYAYLADKIYGVPTYYDYKRWHLGPYPPEMKKAIKNTKYFTQKGGFIQTVNTETLLKYDNPYKEQVNNAIDELAALFASYPDNERANKTELLATVCKVIEDTQSLDLQIIRQSMKDWPIELTSSGFKNKAEKFSEDETRKCISFIVGKGWDEKLKNKNCT